jgi:transposase
VRKPNTSHPSLTIGLDISDRWTHMCAIDAEGRCVGRARVATRESALVDASGKFAGARVVLEVGPHSPWVSRLLGARGHEVVVANPRRVKLIGRADRKTDRIDAETLARLGRMDPALLHPIVHRGAQAQKDLALLRVRDGMVRARTQLIQRGRGLAKALGVRLPASTATGFAKRVREAGRSDVFPGLEELLRAIEQLSVSIRKLEHEIEHLGAQRYPETRRLRQVAGVGPITSLAYVLTIEDPRRFARSRDAGAYLGLTPRQRESGEARPELAISKRGDEFVRRLLIEAAHYTLGPFGPDSELRRFGLRLAGQGGQRAKKRAVVAVARKLAVLLHRLWVSGELYEPLRPVQRAA